MSYGRNPMYIYSDGKELYLDGVYVPEEAINAFLYKILLTSRREELSRRLQEGKNVWLQATTFIVDDCYNYQDVPDVEYFKWMETMEDEILHKLMK